MLTGSLFEEIDVAIDSSLCCTDDDQQGYSDVVKLSEVHTSQVCLPTDHRPSPSTDSANNDTPAQADNTSDTIHQSTVMSDYEVCVHFMSVPVDARKLMANHVACCLHSKTLLTCVARHH